MHFFTAFPDDWLVGTANLTTEESGAFWNLCCYYVAKDGRVPDDARLLARVVKLSTRRWGLVRRTLIAGGFIEVRDGFIWQAKCEERLEKDGKFARSQQDKVRKKWAEKNTKPLSGNDSADTPVYAGADASPAPAPAIRKKEDIYAGLPAGDSASLDSPPEYHWRGKVVRLKEADYESWRKSYFSIPDLDAELTRIDDALASQGKTQKWFPAASAMLASKHQKNLERLKAESAVAAGAYKPMVFEG